MKGPRRFYSDGAELRAGQGLSQRHLEQGMDTAHRSCARAGEACGRQKLVCTKRCGWGGVGRRDVRTLPRGRAARAAAGPGRAHELALWGSLRAQEVLEVDPRT